MYKNLRLLSRVGCLVVTFAPREYRMTKSIPNLHEDLWLQVCEIESVMLSFRTSHIVMRNMCFIYQKQVKTDTKRAAG